MLATPLTVVGLGYEQPVPIFQQLAGGGIDISHETVRFWWNRFGPMFAAEIR